MFCPSPGQHASISNTKSEGGRVRILCMYTCVSSTFIRGSVLGPASHLPWPFVGTAPSWSEQLQGCFQKTERFPDNQHHLLFAKLFPLLGPPCPQGQPEQTKMGRKKQDEQRVHGSFFRPSLRGSTMPSGGRDVAGFTLMSWSLISNFIPVIES